MEITEGIVIAAIACLPTIITLICSCITTYITTKKEIERMKMAWDYKDWKEYEKEFADMLSAVKDLIDNRTSGELKEAIWKINLLRVQSDGAVLSLLNSLYSELAFAKKMVIDWNRIEILLANLVDVISKKETNSGLGIKRGLPLSALKSRRRQSK